MKIKPILYASAFIILGCLLLVQCKQKINKEEEISKFLNLFSLQVQGKQTDSLVNHFNMPQKRQAVIQLVNMLCGKTGLAKGSKPVFKVVLNTSDSDIKTLSDSLHTVTFKVKFSRDTNNIEDELSPLTFRIKETRNHVFKITEVDAKAFLEDYVAFENIVRANTLTDADIYSPQTLAAFKTAAQLKTKYDSIPWFQHLAGQTYYFAVKGQLNVDDAMGLYASKPVAATYKMGLVAPDGREIIPLAYSLVHNIAASLPGLIEVEANEKRGFYNLAGQLVLPVEFDQVFPLNDGENLAVLRKGDDYYWWKTDYTISEKDANLKITDLLTRLQAYGRSTKWDDGLTSDVMECNSRMEHESVYIPPSYLADWALFPAIQYFKNPLRKNVSYENASELYELEFEGKAEPASFLSSVFYSIKDKYLGGRSGLYERKNVLVVNKQSNRVYGHAIESYLTEMDGNSSGDNCTISKLRAVNDTLYEIVVGANTYKELYNGKIISGAPEYHYLQLKEHKLQELSVNRLFGFTKYVQMDDSYLNGCYQYFNGDKTTVQKVNPEMLRYMKNEIYADYKYLFKDERWRSILGQSLETDKLNADVTDSLTAIDKYNISFINQKLAKLGDKSKALASKQ